MDELRQKEIARLYKEAQQFSTDSNEYAAIMKCIDTLAKQEADVKRIKNERLDVVLRAMGVGAGIAVTGILKLLFGKAAFVFEETGTIGTKIGRTFLEDILRGK